MTMRLEGGTRRMAVMGDDAQGGMMCSRPTTPTTNATKSKRDGG